MSTNAAADRRARLRSLVEELYPGRGGALLPSLETLLGRRGLDLGRDEAGPGPALGPESALLIAYPDMIAGREGSPLSRLADFAESRLRGLFSHIHLLPFYPSSSDEGFSVMDHRAVDPRLGTWGEIEGLGRSFSLAFDLVLNHASAKGRWFADFLRGRGPYDRFFVTRPEGYDARAVFRPRTHPLLTAFTKEDGSVARVWTTFSADQVDLDYGEPELLLEMIDVVLDYLAHGARILRLDAVAFAWKEDGSSCVDLPRVHSLVALFRELLDAAAPGAALLTETNLPNEVNLSYFGSEERPEAAMVYNFSLPPLLLHALLKGEAGPLAAWAAALPEPGPARIFVNFLSSHDGIGVTPLRGLLPEGSVEELAAAVLERGGLVSERSTAEGTRPYELNTSYLDAVSPAGAGEAERLRAFLTAHAVMYALAGLPALWFHSLVGTRNWAEGPAITGSKRSIHRARPEIDLLCRELDDPESLRARAFRGQAALLRARARRRALAPASPQLVLRPDGSGTLLSGAGRSSAAGAGRGGRAAAGAAGAGAGAAAAGPPPSGPIFGLIRGGPEEALLALVNLSDRPARCAIPSGFEPSGRPFDPSVPEEEGQGVGGAGPIPGAGLEIPPQGCLWLDGRYQGG